MRSTGCVIGTTFPLKASGRPTEVNVTMPTKAWAAKIAQLDAFVFVTPEYNHGPSAALKNGIDYLHREWNNKSVGFVAYGGNGGARAVEMLRQIVSNVELADVRAQVGLSLFTDFENLTTVRPGSHLAATVTTMLDQVIAWSSALKPLRTAKSN
jgi:NAD(P)H-dependent FMN reductase